jgi:ketosteroid isomerase-like protein
MKNWAWAGVAVVSSVFAYGALADVAPAPLRKSAGVEELREQVRKTEEAFARTMAQRDLTAFAGFLAPEAVFLGEEPLHGAKAVVAGWAKYFQGPTAPFSWAPESVEVIESGGLAISKGPVFDPQGTRVGTFVSTWRREPNGKWRIVLDTGCPPCPSCPPKDK